MVRCQGHFSARWNCQRQWNINECPAASHMDNQQSIGVLCGFMCSSIVTNDDLSHPKNRDFSANQCWPENGKVPASGGPLGINRCYLGIEPGTRHWMGGPFRRNRLNGISHAPLHALCNDLLCTCGKGAQVPLGIWGKGCSWLQRLMNKEQLLAMMAALQAHLLQEFGPPAGDVFLRKDGYFWCLAVPRKKLVFSKCS